ncbi:MAG: AlpA family phage regulatory protein [Gammaproteobacteria bacterium]|nr:AlpA family phage regulatory protein [Gammaproteobacteria bacterium]
MQVPFNNNIKEIADSMGIALYQRFSLNEASVFLHCSESDIKEFLQQDKLEYIKVTESKVEFFGYQLLGYLLNSVSGNIAPEVNNSLPDRILRSKEVQDMTGLSRTTIWRLERKGDFPARIVLGENSIGWRFLEINEWMLNRQAK